MTYTRRGSGYDTKSKRHNLRGERRQRGLSPLSGNRPQPYRRRVVEPLRETEERLRWAAAAGGVGLFEWNLKTDDVFWTEETSKMLGLPKRSRHSKLISQRHSYSEWASRVHPDDLRRLEKKLRGCVAQGLPFEDEYRVVWPDGTVRWLHGRGVFQYDGKGKPERMLGVDMDVTDRVRAQEARHDSEMRYRSLFEQSPDGIVVVNKAGTIVMANHRLKKLFGYHHRELEGQPVEILVPERLRERHVKQREGYQSAPRLRVLRRSAELFGRRKSGTEFPIEISLSAADPSTEGCVTAIVRDVSEQVHAEMQLKESAARLQERVSERTHELTSAHSELRSTLQSIGDGFIACDSSWRLIYINRAAERMLALQREHSVGRIFWDLFPLTIGTKLEHEYRAAAAGRIREFENLYEPWNRWFYNRCYPREGGGASIYFTEITARKRAEEALQQSQERLRAIIESAPVAILSTDEKGVLEALNPAAQQLFGYGEKEMLGQEIGQFMATVHQQPNKPFLGEFLEKSGKPVLGLRREVLGKCRNGRIVVLELTVAEFLLSERRKYVAMARDITALKRLERELLEGAERERQRLGHDLHDGLGQHLHALYYRASLLHKDLQEDRSPRAREAARLSKFLNQAIELARGVARGLQPVPAMPEGLMTSLRELAERTSELYDVDCRFECKTPVLVYEHNAATHLYRIAQEAVNNAMRHAHPSRLRIRLGSTPDKIILGVRDDGAGIHRGAGTSSGLGLHIMQYRANALSGALVVQRVPQGGTEVVCTARRVNLQTNNEADNNGPGDERK